MHFKRMHTYSNPFHAAKKSSTDIYGPEKRYKGQYQTKYIIHGI